MSVDNFSNLLKRCKELADFITYDSTADTIVVILMKIIQQYEPDFIPRSLKECI